MPMSPEEALQLIRTIEANREFMLTLYRQNPELLKLAEPRIQALLALPGERHAALPPAA